MTEIVLTTGETTEQDGVEWTEVTVKVDGSEEVAPIGQISELPETQDPTWYSARVENRDGVLVVRNFIGVGAAMSALAARHFDVHESRKDYDW